jgi:hypothetical protein
MRFRVEPGHKICELKNHLKKDKKREVKNNKDNSNKEHTKFSDILNKLK